MSNPFLSSITSSSSSNVKVNNKSANFFRKYPNRNIRHTKSTINTK